MSTRWRRVLVLLALLVACGAVVAGASFGRATHRPRPPTYGVSIQDVFNAAGNPLLIANFSPDGSLATPRWSICLPDAQGPCTPAAAENHALEPGPEPAGTRFVATASYADRTYSAAVTWQGRVQAVSAPTLRGTPREGGVVDPRRHVGQAGGTATSTSLASKRARPREALDVGCSAAASSDALIAPLVPGCAGGSRVGICSRSMPGSQRNQYAPAPATSRTPTSRSGRSARRSSGPRPSHGSRAHRDRP